MKQQPNLPRKASEKAEASREETKKKRNSDDHDAFIKKRGGRASGSVNYEKELLLNIIEAIIPDGAVGWKLVAERYFIASKDEVLRDYQVIKDYFIKNLCNQGKVKPTGKSSPSDLTQQAITIYAKIKDRMHSKVYGTESDEDEGRADEEVVSVDDSSDDDDDDDVDNDEEEDHENEENDLRKKHFRINSSEVVRPNSGQKSKNCKNSTNSGRQNISNAIIKLCESAASSNSSNSSNDTLKMMAAMMQQQQQQTQMMMMFMMGSKSFADMSSSSSFVTPTGSNQNSSSSSSSTSSASESVVQNLLD